jgi:hypothetical protein
MVDGTETNYASTTTNNDVQLLDANNATGTDLGTITSVEIRAYGYYTDDDTVNLVPVFGGATDGVGSYLNVVPATTPAWGSWFNITADASAPGTWAWSDVQNLDLDVNYDRTGGGAVAYVGEVEIRVSYTSNSAPNMTNITASHSIIQGGGVITIYANTTSNGINDSEADSLTLYCDTTDTPTVANTDCTGGTNSDASYPYAMTCSFATPATSANNTEFCRVYDGTSYSSAVNLTYETDYTGPSLTLDSVAGDTAASYYDTVDDGATEINVTGEAGMVCRWSSSDISYSSMSNDCTIDGTTGSCNVTGLSQAFITSYVACQDSLGNNNNATDNLDVSFTLDYTAPTTSDDSSATVVLANYTVNISEADNVDGSPDTLYCTDTADTCTPDTVIDDGEQVTFTNSNRGVNYFRYNSTDDAGNTQAIQSSTININQLPVFTSAADDAVTIGGGWMVNITTISSDADSHDITLFVCNSTNVNSSGCIDLEYCTASASDNVSCSFAAESDSDTHTWYAFVYDALGEIAVNNDSGSYTTDVDAPTITIDAPEDIIYSQENITARVDLNEVSDYVVYSLDGEANVSMSNVTLLRWTATLSSLSNGTHNITFYANDSYGNMNVSSIQNFTINISVIDTTPPDGSIWSPTNNTYYTTGSILINLTSDEALSWAGYELNSNGTLFDLSNISLTEWNVTIVLPEGNYNVTVYANDTSNNQASGERVFYVDLNNPVVSNFSCSDVDDSEDVVCTIEASDAIGLENYKVGYNASGSWVNSSLVDLTGTSNSTSFTIGSGNHSPVGFVAQLYVYDLAGKLNDSFSDVIVISDDTLPVISDVVYSPNETDDLDSGVAVNVNATVTEDYNISVVYLMYWNESSTEWTYVVMDNNSALVVGSESVVVYNASFTPEEGNWTFRINATDFVGNENVSDNITVVVEDEISEDITNTISAIESITYSERDDNYSLGNLVMNNTGEATIWFNVSLTADDSDVESRLSVNNTGLQTGDFSAAIGVDVNITIDVNTTDLTADVYDYNITIVSDVGTTVLERQLNVQVAAGPYLVTTITTYSSSVDQGDTSVSYVASVTNLGTGDATDVYLNWTLPSGFTLASGSLTRSLGALGVSVSGTNTITIDVDDSATAADVEIVANASSSNADFSSDSKTVTIGTLVTSVDTPSTSGGGGGGGVSGAAGGTVESISFTETIEIVRGGGSLSFDIVVSPNYFNSSLQNLTLEIAGFLEQYISVSPSLISFINYGESRNFTVVINAPSYKGYEEHNLTATIKGGLVRGNIVSKYTEEHTIDLVIQEVSFEESSSLLDMAKENIALMVSMGFNVDSVSKLFDQAHVKSEERINNEVYDLAEEIIKIKEKAFFTNGLIRGLIVIERDPRKSHYLSGNVIDAIGEENGKSFFDFFTGRAVITGSVVGNGIREAPLSSLITGDVVFSGEGVQDLIGLAIVAFERGDYDLAEERAESAKTFLLLERKGNVGLFFYLYWHVLFIVMVSFLLVGVFSYRKYQKVSLIKRVIDNDNEEKAVQDNMIKSQKDYFAGKIGPGDYKSAMRNSKKKLANLKDHRQKLRLKRRKTLKPKQLMKHLESEKVDVENRIKKMQAGYYVDRTISEEEYEFQFKLLTERLAEIEGERAEIDVEKGEKSVVSSSYFSKEFIKDKFGGGKL